MTVTKISTPRGIVEAAEAIAFAETGQQLYRAANGMKMCPDCDGRWIPESQDLCFPCALVVRVIRGLR